MSQVKDFIIKGALVYDGSGAAPRVGDVHVSGSCVKACGERLQRPQGAEVVDASGLSLSPGFIDVHGHSDVSLLAAPEATGKLSQGVTTEVAGNCGLSVFPATTPEVREHFADIYRQYPVKFTWDGIDGYVKELERRRPAINLASLCGHNTLRACVCGYKDSPCGPKELDAMAKLLSGTLSGGAAGLSTGLLYVPGKFSKMEELKALSKELAPAGKIHATHLRSEGARLLEAIDEAVQVSFAGSKRLHVSHFKTAGRENWAKLDAAIEALDSARAAGLEVTADRYPYIYSKTNLSVVLPAPYSDMDDASISKALCDFKALEALAASLDDSGRDWQMVLLASTSSEFARPFCGLSIADISARLDISPGHVCAIMMRDDASGTDAAFGGMSQFNLQRILALPWVACGSDESARPASYSIGRSHPRGFGSFPRFLNNIAGSLGMAEALRRATSLPASIFRIPKRGLIAPGNFADLVLFDERRLKDEASFAHPHRVASGIVRVWVSGVLSWDSGASSGPRAGSFLRL